MDMWVVCSFGASIKNATVNFLVQFFLRACIFVSVSKCLGKELLDHRIDAWASQVAQWWQVKNPSANEREAREESSITQSGRSHGGGNGNPLQYSCLESPMDRGTWRATVMGSQRGRYDCARTHPG